MCTTAIAGNLPQLQPTSFAAALGVTPRGEARPSGCAGGPQQTGSQEDRILGRIGE